jgi:YHS domain-containing protein
VESLAGIKFVHSRSILMRMIWKLFFTTASMAAPSALPAQTLPPNASIASQSQAETWQKVDNKKVCMVTDMVFPREQIPVQVGKKTYYGCCENCKTRLGEDETVRFAIDPISAKQVDKATARIAAGPDGSVHYFENDSNVERFIALRKKAGGPAK